MNKKGFTLVELLAIVILLGILFTLVFPNIVRQLEKNEAKIDEYTLALIYSAADNYVKKHDITEVGSTHCVEISKLDEENLIPVSVDKYLKNVIRIKIGEHGINSKMMLESCEEYVTITYDANGGSVNPSSTTVKYGKTAKLAIPSRGGYTFEGWFTELENGLKIDDKTKWKKSTKVYAYWVISTYTINYDPNGGTVDKNEDIVKHNESLELPTPSREGYTFEGWFTEKLGGMQVDNETKWTADQTIYARYTVNSYVVTLNPNGGSLEKTELSVNHDETINLPTPERNGYTFEGWYTEENGGEVVTNETKWTSSSTIYAHWKQN